MKRDPILDTIELLRDEPRLSTRAQLTIVLCIAIPPALFWGAVILKAMVPTL
jgi:hypothetical protein